MSAHHEVRLSREFEYSEHGSGPWIVHYGHVEVKVGGLWNRIAIDSHPPCPSQKKIDKAIEKARRIHDADHAAEHSEAIEHGNLVDQARQELEEG